MGEMFWNRERGLREFGGQFQIFERKLKAFKREFWLLFKRVLKESLGGWKSDEVVKRFIFFEIFAKELEKFSHESFFLFSEFGFILLAWPKISFS